MPRQLFIDGMQSRGIGVVVNYRPVHLTSYFSEVYKYSKGDFPAAEFIGERVVSLPLFPSMATDDVTTVVDAVIDTIGKA
jgi:dTDP-4-amino-4,6-dideoxygalactose transaminase